MPAVSQEEMDRVVREEVAGLLRLLAQQAQEDQRDPGPGPTFPSTPPLQTVWQRWQADADQWVPLDHLPPGYAADPPPWTPLEGEILQTPAFSIGEYAATAAAGAQEKIDVVIPYRLENDGEELRYAIRSIEKFFTPLGRIWIVGDRPSWLRPDGERLIHLNVAPICRIADVDIWHKLMVACLRQRPRLTERFVFWSDDQIALRPVGWEQLGPYHFGDLAALNPWPTGGPYHEWWQRMRHTMEFLRGQGKPTLHGDVHMPIPMDRDGVVRLLQSVPWKQAPGLCVGTLWLNWTPGWAERSQPLREQKVNITEPLSAEQLRQRLAGRWFVCHTPQGWTKELRELLRLILPDESPWEPQPTIRVKPAGPTLSIVIPTLGRPTLRRTLESIRQQELIEGDEVILVQDGPEREDVRRLFEEMGLPGKYLGLDRQYKDSGATPRNAGMALARGDYLIFCDDDDFYAPNSFRVIRDVAQQYPKTPLMFRNRVDFDFGKIWQKGQIRWQGQIVQPGNVGGQMFVVPNISSKLAKWPAHRGSDYGFIFSTLQLWGGKVIWRPEIISVYAEQHAESHIRPVTKNLLYHIYPLRENNIWYENAQELKKYWQVFTGRKIIGIAIDENTVSPKEVQAAFGDSTIEWIIQQNDPKLGERLTFAEGLKRLRSLNPDEATFYAHAKGVGNWCAKMRAVNKTLMDNLDYSVRQWRNYMYEYCLSPPVDLDAILRTYAAAGCFQYIGDVGKDHEAAGDVPCHWFFAGTFYWFNHMWYFGHHCSVPLRNNRWAAEYHLGSMFTKEQSYCFLECPPKYQYRMYFMNQEQWRQLLSDPSNLNKAKASLMLQNIYRRFVTLTDKGTIHSYLGFYAHYLNRLQPITLVEIGVDRGGSLLLWSDWLHSDSRIIGIDLKPPLTLGKNIKTIQADATTPGDWLAQIDHCDVVIDDGDHREHSQLKTFSLLWPKLRPGGLYIIEDVQSEDAARNLLKAIPGAKALDLRSAKGRYDDYIIWTQKPIG